MNPLVVVREQFKTVDGVRVPQGRGLWLWCPGCEMAHRPQVAGEDGSVPDDHVTWDWNGRTDEGFSIEPSLLCHYTVHLCENEHQPVVCEDPENCGQTGHLILNATRGSHDLPAPEDRVRGHNTPHTREPAWGSCHSFIRQGQWQFLSDSGHKLAGQTVPMVPVPDWLVR